MGTLAGRMSRISEPETLAMARRSRELAAKGLKVINLTLGEPDFPTPDVVKKSGMNAIRNNYSYYSPVNGFLELREVICKKLARENELEYSPNQIVITTGAKQAIANAILTTVDPGDEVILIAPYWVSYYDIVRFAQGVPVVLQSTVKDNFKVSPGRIAAAITSKTRMVIINSPSNPSGTVYSDSELGEIAEILRKHERIFVLSDEIYEHIIYTGKHHSIARYPFLKERVIVVNGVSKSFAMTGWRLGYLAATEEIAKACTTLQGQFTSGTSSISQQAAITAIDKGLESARAMCDEFKKRRDRCIGLLNDIMGISTVLPEGAFYFFPDISSYFGATYGNTTIRNSSEMSLFLLGEGLVSTVPGAAFGSPECIRISFAASMENLMEGIKRIKDTLGKLVLSERDKIPHIVP